MVNSAWKRYLLPGYSRRRNSYSWMAAFRSLSPGLKLAAHFSQQLGDRDHAGVGFAGVGRHVIHLAIGIGNALIVAAGSFLLGASVQRLTHLLGLLELIAGLLLARRRIAGETEQAGAQNRRQCQPPRRADRCGMGWTRNGEAQSWLPYSLGQELRHLHKLADASRRQVAPMARPRGSAIRRRLFRPEHFDYRCGLTANKQRKRHGIRGVTPSRSAHRFASVPQGRPSVRANLGSLVCRVRLSAPAFPAAFGERVAIQIARCAN